jgi:hypothetical protein
MAGTGRTDERYDVCHDGFMNQDEKRSKQETRIELISDDVKLLANNLPSQS